MTITNEQLQSIKDGWGGGEAGHALDADKLHRLLDDMSSYADKRVGSIRIDMDDVRAILALATSSAAIVTELQVLRAQVDKLTHENEALVDSVENGVIIQNWFDLIEELGVPPGGSLWDTVLRLHREKQNGRDAIIEQCVTAVAAVFPMDPALASGPIADAIRALATQAPAVTREAALPVTPAYPLAWHVSAGGGYEHGLFDDSKVAEAFTKELLDNGWGDVVTTPLYARSAPAAAPSQPVALTRGVTLTQKQIEAALNNLIGTFPHTPSIITASGRSEIACAIIAAQRGVALPRPDRGGAAR